MSDETFVDHYEMMQLSVHADSDTIHRVYRLLAQRFHPDQKESGNADVFRRLTQAYHTLSDPERRAAYDVEHTQKHRLNWKIFDQANSAQGVESETRKRQGVVSVLYRKRVADPENAAMTLKEMEGLLGVPKEHLEFTLWYLRESQCVARSDNARFTITLKGVELAETYLAKPAAEAPPTSAMRLVRAANDRLSQTNSR